jgi:hypothetical protein
MPFHKITAICQETNGPFIHYKASLGNGDTAHFTRTPDHCAPEVGDLVHEDGATDGVPHYECLRPALTHGDNLRFNRMMARMPDPGYWHYKVVTALITSRRGRMMVRLQQEDTACRELLAVGAVWLSGAHGGPVWACIGID